MRFIPNTSVLRVERVANAVFLDYDSSTGRFLTRDPAKAGSNWYDYCSNNPNKTIDPTGLDSWLKEKWDWLVGEVGEGLDWSWGSVKAVGGFVWRVVGIVTIVKPVASFFAALDVAKIKSQQRLEYNEWLNQHMAQIPEENWTAITRAEKQEAIDDASDVMGDSWNFLISLY